jgi:L-iditol 2-dehydrogenase
MRALVFLGTERMELRQIDVPDLQPGELRVRVRHAGICGTDLRIYTGTKFVEPPRVIGHEFAGRIAQVGADVTNYSVGDRVVVYPVIACGHCYACLDGRRNICVNRRTMGYELDGGFAEYVTVPADAVAGGNVIMVPDALSDEAAAASEPVAAALQGIRQGGVGAGKTVLINGAGPLGLAHVQLSKLYGAERVVVSEPSEQRRQTALAHGADMAVAPTDLGDVFPQAGPDVAFVDVGLPSLVEASVARLRKGGTCVIFAGMPPQSSVQFDPNDLHYREIQLIGSSGSTPTLQAEVLEQAARGALDLDAFVSDVLPLDDWQQGFSMKQSVAGIKVLLDMDR